MTIHYILASGYELTECRLETTPQGEELTSFLERVTCSACKWALIRSGRCSACESKTLEWGFHVKDFYLGCGYCSATLIAAVDPFEVAAALTKLEWVP